MYWLLNREFWKECTLSISVRTGIGVDVHAFCEGKKLIIGGVHILYSKGLEGHSDADVLLHAIMDAVLGACGLSDIGSLFPDSDSKYKNASSIALLGDVSALVKNRGFKVNYIDSVVIAQKPLLSGHIPAMKTNIARVLGMELTSVNVKATSTEYLGFVGREEGIAAIAVSTVESQVVGLKNRIVEDDNLKHENNFIETANVFDHSPGSEKEDYTLLPMLNNLGKIVCYTDGSSLGNPGPAGCSVVVCDDVGEPLVAFKWSIGRNTSNIAEYKAIYELIAWLYGLDLQSKNIEIRSDSELAVKQLSGVYKVKSDLLRPVWLETSRLMSTFKSLQLKHVEREVNKLADILARSVAGKKRNN